MPFPHVANHILSTQISMLCPTLPTINEHTLVLSVEIAADRFLMLFPALPTGKRVVLVAKMDILPKFVAPNPSSALVLSNK
jgi:hypothetical protein